jgi:nitroreductase
MEATMAQTTTILEDLKWRYACKRFDSSRKIQAADLDTILETLNLTATSLGMQLLKCVVVENQIIKEQLVAHAYGQRQVADCSHLLVLCRYSSVDQDAVDEYVNRTAYIRNMDANGDKMKGFKRMIENTMLMSEGDRLNWMNNQAYIALGNLLTVCASMRIDSCPMEGFVPSKVDELLDLKSFGLESVLLCPIGFRHAEDPYAVQPKVRKSLEDFIVKI